MSQAITESTLLNDFESITKRLEVIERIRVPEVTSLTAEAVDGAEADLLVDSAGTYGGPFLWRCKFRAATPGAYKWHPLGALELLAEQTANVGLVTSTTYVTSGSLAALPALVIPVAGDWRITVAATGMYKTTTAGTGFISYSVGAAAAADADAALLFANAAPGDVEASLSATRPKLAIPAGTTVQAKARTSAGQFFPTGNALFPCALRAMPVRIG